MWKIDVDAMMRNKKVHFMIAIQSTGSVKMVPKIPVVIPLRVKLGTCTGTVHVSYQHRCDTGPG